MNMHPMQDSWRFMVPHHVPPPIQFAHVPRPSKRKGLARVRTPCISVEKNLAMEGRRILDEKAKYILLRYKRPKITIQTSTGRLVHGVNV